jgi:hypothetical protein
MRNVDIPEQPRLSEPSGTTPAALGPGAYHAKAPAQEDRSIFKASQPKAGRQPNLQFGTDPRFKFDFQKAVSPGPGQYNDQNKWNKRTYNLKFLNFQAHAFQNQQKYQKLPSPPQRVTDSEMASGSLNNSTNVMQNQRLFDAQNNSGYTQGAVATTAGQTSNFDAPQMF